MSDHKSGITPDSDAMTLSEIRETIDSDKKLAVDVAKEARSEIASFRMLRMTADITGKPDGVNQFNRYKREQLRSLETVTQSPFFARYRALMAMNGKEEKIDLLITQAGGAGAVVIGEGWLLTTWTTPLGLKIRSAKPGETIQIQVRRGVTTYDVNELSRYENLLPQAINGRFAVLGRQGTIASEDELANILCDQAATTDLASVEYEAKRMFGLDDLIVLVDEPQQAALGLPFDKHVIVEGPPGSGKTSVGIMRIKVLYDQQWDQLELQQDRDRPFHDFNSMRILVYNEEMVEYLQNLALSIGVQHVQVMTTKEFFKRICRLTRTLTGTDRQDPSSLRIIKGRREALIAFFAGFRIHTRSYWKKHEVVVRNRLADLGPDFVMLADTISGWIARVQEALVEGDIITGAINIADSITEAATRIERGNSMTRTVRANKVDGRDIEKPQPLNLDQLRDRLPDAQKIVNETIRTACSRTSICRTMFGLDEYQELKATLAQSGVPKRVIEDADRLWRRQYRGDLPAYSELDLAMSAWLGAKVLLSAIETRPPWIGGQLEKLTHIVVDEAQDLSPGHLAVLTSQLSPNGTMSLVGDLHQNLNPHAGLQHWGDVKLSEAVLSAFAVNHRQTRQLGEFMQQMHTGLFGEECKWKPSSKTIGQIPRAGICKSWTELASAVATETRYWREKIGGTTGATVAVLYDGKLQPKRIRWLKERLELALNDMLVTVEAAMPSAGSEALRRTDRVIIASVRQTKGLEFDAVVFVEPRPRWSKPVELIDLRHRNGFYVATSRARAGLSLAMSNLPTCVESAFASGTCSRCEWHFDGDIE